MNAVLASQKVRGVLEALRLGMLTVDRAHVQIAEALSGDLLGELADARRLNSLLTALVEENVTFLQALESHANGGKFFNVASAKQAIDYAEAACTPQAEQPSSSECQLPETSSPTTAGASN